MLTVVAGLAAVALVASTVTSTPLLLPPCNSYHIEVWSQGMDLTALQDRMSVEAAAPETRTVGVMCSGLHRRRATTIGEGGDKPYVAEARHLRKIDMLDMPWKAGQTYMCLSVYCSKVDHTVESVREIACPADRGRSNTYNHQYHPGRLRQIAIAYGPTAWSDSLVWKRDVPYASNKQQECPYPAGKLTQLQRDAVKQKYLGQCGANNNERDGRYRTSKRTVAAMAARDNRVGARAFHQAESLDAAKSYVEKMHDERHAKFTFALEEYDGNMEKIHETVQKNTFALPACLASSWFSSSGAQDEACRRACEEYVKAKDEACASTSERKVTEHLERQARAAIPMLESMVNRPYGRRPPGPPPPLDKVEAIAVG